MPNYGEKNGFILLCFYIFLYIRLWIFFYSLLLQTAYKPNRKKFLPDVSTIAESFSKAENIPF